MDYLLFNDSMIIKVNNEKHFIFIYNFFYYFTFIIWLNMNVLRTKEKPYNTQTSNHR